MKRTQNYKATENLYYKKMWPSAIHYANIISPFINLLGPLKDY